MPGKFRALTGQTKVIWPLLVVECEFNSVQALKLRARGTVVPLRKGNGCEMVKKKKRIFKLSVTAFTLMMNVCDRATNKVESGNRSL